MKHILFLLLFLPVLAFAQFPANPNKIRLGNQTTADGLVVRTAASPSWTPSSINNAWLAFDTVAVKLYYYDGGTWNEYTGGSVNIGNTDLTLTGNRRLNTGGYQFWIQDGTGAEVPYIFIGGDQVSFAASTTTSVYLDSSEQRAAIVAGAVIDIDADSIRIIGTQPNDNSLNRLLALDTITNRLHYVDKSSIPDTDTNFAEDNLTFSGNRVHNLSTRTLTIADGGTYPTYQQSSATDGITLASSATDLIAQTPGLLQIENSDTITVTADRIRMNAADTRIQQVANDNALNRLVALDSLTGQLKYIDKSSISSGGTVTGTGTTGTIPVWSSSSALGDSPLTVSSGSVIAGGTGFFRFPVGTTAQRPGTPTTGDARYNSTLGNLDFYGASAWENPLRSATGNGLGTAGRVFYADAAGRAAADDVLHWDATNNRLGVNITAPNTTLHIAGGLARFTQGYYLGSAGAGAAAWIFPYSTAPTSLDSAGANISFYSYSTSIYPAFSVVGATVTATSGTGGMFFIGKAFSPTSGTAVYSALDIMTNKGINQTGGANGITRGIYVNPNIVAAADYRGIELSNNTGRGIHQTGTSATNNLAGATMIGATTTPARTLHVTGEARITDLTTDTPTQIVGADADGDLGAITVGSGLSLSSGTLTATGAGTTNLAFSGASSPVTLTSDTGTDVIFAAGSGLALSQSGGTATYSRTYSLTHITISGGSTFFGTTAERPDNDTPGSATTSTVGSDFSVSGSTIDYTGASGALLRVEGSISFSVADDGDYYLSIYKEGSELGATSMRVSCVAGNYYSISLPATTTTGSTNDTFDLRIATVSGNSTTTMHRYGYILERIY